MHNAIHLHITYFQYSILYQIKNNNLLIIVQRGTTGERSTYQTHWENGSNYMHRENRTKN